MAIDSIVEIGRTIRFLSPISATNSSPLDDRQADALGVVHDRVRHLSVGVVGAGGLDHDTLDTESNVRRVFGAKLSDLWKNSHKVEVVGQHLDEIGSEVSAPLSTAKWRDDRRNNI